MRLQETDALKKACLYSLQPNRLGYCGPEGSWLLFQNFLSTPSEQNALSARNALLDFHALHPYLKLIAESNNMNPFDAEVVEAYWIGNRLLEKVSHEALRRTILSFQNFGLPKSIAEEKAARLPEGMLPHHSMHVLYVNFISGKVKPLVQNLSNCLVLWAEVKEAGEKGVIAKTAGLFSESGELKLREKEGLLKNPFGLQLRGKDRIAMHWRTAIENISSDRLKNLKKHTIKNLELVNAFPWWFG